MPLSLDPFRPISLCNVVYKLVTEVISNRLKEVLLGIISKNQNASIHGHLISDNILIAFEVFHLMNCKDTYLIMEIKLDILKLMTKLSGGFL